jgi:hypothetical protein
MFGFVGQADGESVRSVSDIGHDEYRARPIRSTHLVGDAAARGMAAINADV